MTNRTEDKTSVDGYLSHYDVHFSGFHDLDEKAAPIARVLGQQNANNVFLTGKKGSGKSALVAAIAQNDKQKDFIFLNAKEIFKTEDKKESAGTISSLLDAAEKNSDTVLVVEDISTLMTNLYNNQLSYLANRLASDLRLGKVQMIAMSNEEDPKEIASLKKSIPTFDSMFTQVVHEPADKEAVAQILTSTRESYETAYQGLVKVSEEADQEIVRLTHKYEASAYAHLAEPERSLRVRDMIMSTFFTHLKSDAFGEVSEHEQNRKHIRTMIAEQQAKIHDSSKLNIGETIDSVRKKLKQLKTLQANNDNNYQEAFQQSAAQNGQLTLTVEDIQNAFTQITGLKVSRSDREELEKIQNAESVLTNRVMGQDHAVSTVAASYKRSQILKKKKRKKPIASYLFIGPSGVGKTELTLALSELIGDLVELDMGEYDSEQATKRMTGADPGLVGYEEGGKLTNEVKQKPNSVVLLDEIEKAHPKVYDPLLAVLDKGQLTDNKGETVDFTNTIVIMTSNFGVHEFENTEYSFEESCEIIKRRMRAKDSPFRPEFLNRITEVIFFKDLEHDIMYKIIDMNFRKTQKEQLEEGVNITATPETLKAIVDAKYSKENGVRVAKKYVTDELENLVAEKLITHQIAAIDAGEEAGILNLELVFDETTRGIAVIEQSQEQAQPKAATPSRMAKAAHSRPSVA